MKKIPRLIAYTLFILFILLLVFIRLNIENKRYGNILNRFSSIGEASLIGEWNVDKLYFKFFTDSKVLQEYNISNIGKYIFNEDSTGTHINDLEYESNDFSWKINKGTLIMRNVEYPNTEYAWKISKIRRNRVKLSLSAKHESINIESEQILSRLHKEYDDILKRFSSVEDSNIIGSWSIDKMHYRYYQDGQLLEVANKVDYGKFVFNSDNSGIEIVYSYNDTIDFMWSFGERNLIITSSFGKFNGSIMKQDKANKDKLNLKGEINIRDMNYYFEYYLTRLK